MVIVMTDVNVSTHSNLYYDSKIPHKVTFIDYSIEKPKGLQGVGNTKIMIRYISPVDSPVSLRGEQIISKYNVIEQVASLIKALYEYIQQHNPTPSSKLSPFITLDIVELNDRKGLHFSYNLVKDGEKIIFSIISQNIEIDGNEFPQVIIPILVSLSKSFNYMRPETKKHMLSLLTEVYKKFLETNYYIQILTSIPNKSEQNVLYHLSMKVVPQILSDISNGMTTVKKRNVDSIISIQRNNFSKAKEWALMLINFQGKVNVPVVINNKIMFAPRQLGGEAVKVPLNFIGIDEMYKNIIPDVEVRR